MIREHDEILRSTVRLARLSFAAAAASVSLYDQERKALVFEACSGVGEDRLVGVAIPPDQGIAGWVAGTGEALVVRAVAHDDRFDREFAAQTGLIPDVIMAAPLERGGEVLGVLEVLDPSLETVGELLAIDMLTELAAQSCAALALLVADREARAMRSLTPSGADPHRIAAFDDLVSALSRLLR